MQQVIDLQDQAERKLDELAKGDADVQRLQTIPGVGPRTAEAVVAFLPEPKRFKSGKQVSSYGGFTPRQYQSSELELLDFPGKRRLERKLVERPRVLRAINSLRQCLGKSPLVLDGEPSEPDGAGRPGRLLSEAGCAPGPTNADG